MCTRCALGASSPPFLPSPVMKPPFRISASSRASSASLAVEAPACFLPFLLFALLVFAGFCEGPFCDTAWLWPSVKVVSVSLNSLSSSATSFSVRAAACKAQITQGLVKPRLESTQDTVFPENDCTVVDLQVTTGGRAHLAIKDVSSLMPGLLKQLQRRVLAFPSVAGAHCAVAVLQLGIGQVPDQRNALPPGQACIKKAQAWGGGMQTPQEPLQTTLWSSRLCSHDFGVIIERPSLHVTSEFNLRQGYHMLSTPLISDSVTP